MSPDQLARLRAKIIAARHPDERTDRYASTRLWNEALDNVLKWIREETGEGEPTP